MKLMIMLLCLSQSVFAIRECSTEDKRISSEFFDQSKFNAFQTENNIIFSRLYQALNLAELKKDFEELRKLELAYKKFPMSLEMEADYSRLLELGEEKMSKDEKVWFKTLSKLSLEKVSPRTTYVEALDKLKQKIMTKVESWALEKRGEDFRESNDAVFQYRLLFYKDQFGLSALKTVNDFIDEFNDSDKNLFERAESLRKFAKLEWRVKHSIKSDFIFVITLDLTNDFSLKVTSGVPLWIKNDVTFFESSNSYLAKSLKSVLAPDANVINLNFESKVYFRNGEEFRNSYLSSRNRSMKESVEDDILLEQLRLNFPKYSCRFGSN